MVIPVARRDTRCFKVIDTFRILIEIGSEFSEQLNYLPAKVHMREKRCPDWLHPIPPLEHNIFFATNASRANG
jgi:hypothetical protein